jgi:hypothetical protein
MSRPPCHLLIATFGVVLGLAALPARATAQPAAAAPDSGRIADAADIAAAEAAAAARPASPLQAEVDALRAAFSAGLADLTARYRAAPDAAAAAEAQRAISAHKQQLELDLLDLQLRLARERRDADATAELEQARTAARERLAADTGRELPATTADTDTAKERQP